MRTILFAVFMVLLSSACTDTGKPANVNTLPPPPADQGGSPNSAQQGGAFMISTEAYYQATIKSPSSPGSVISLSLTPAREAEMITDNPDQHSIVRDTGSWSTQDNGNLLLNLRRIGQNDSIMLEFKTDGDKLVYVGSDYGNTGLVLWVKPVPEPK